MSPASRSAILCRLHPCSPSGFLHTGLVYSAHRAPFRPSQCKVHHVPPRTSTTLHILAGCCARPSTSSHVLRRWHGNNKLSLQVCNAKDKVNGSREGMSLVEDFSTIFSFGLDFFYANFLPSILVSAVILGLAFPSLGQRAYQVGLSKWATFGVFFISGLSLRTSEVGEVLQAWLGLLFGVISSLIITPWVAVSVLRFPIIPREFVTGLALFCCMPTTLSSGVSLTQVAGANTALALSLTLISNFLGILTIPLMISKLVAPNLGISVPAGPLIKSLLETSVVPLLIGKVIRACASGFIDKRKKEFSILSALFLGLVPWMQVSCARDLFLSLRIQSFAAAALLGMATHCVFLLWNFWAMHTLQVHITKGKDPYQQKSDAWAIILTASQKTLPVAVAVIGSLGGLMGEAGLLVLPCLTTHITQIIFDSFLVRLWIQGDLQRSLRTKS